MLYKAAANSFPSSEQMDIPVLGKLVLPEGGERQFLLIKNIGAIRLKVVFGREVSATKNEGLIIAPNETYIEKNQDGFTVWQGSITAKSIPTHFLKKGFLEYVVS